MAIKDVDGLETLRADLGDDGVAYLGFFGEFSERSRRQRPVFNQLADKHPDAPLYRVDVGRVKDVHTHYGVTSVPAVIKVRGDKVVQVIAGERPLTEYEALVTGTVLAAAPGTVRRSAPAGSPSTPPRPAPGASGSRTTSSATASPSARSTSRRIPRRRSSSPHAPASGACPRPTSTATSSSASTNPSSTSSWASPRARRLEP